MRPLWMLGVGLGALAVSLTARAEEGDPKAKAAAPPEEDAPAVGVLVEPLLALFGFFEGEVNVTLDDSTAIGIWGQGFSYSLLDTSIDGFGVGAGAPIFLTGRVYEGMYVYPLFKFQKVTYDVASTEVVAATFFGPQVTVGYQWTFGSTFTMRLGGGLEYTFGEVSSPVVSEQASFSGLGLELDGSIGVVF